MRTSEAFRTPIVDVFEQTTGATIFCLNCPSCPICAALIGMWLKVGAEMWVLR